MVVAKKKNPLSQANLTNSGVPNFAPQSVPSSSAKPSTVPNKSTNTPTAEDPRGPPAVLRDGSGNLSGVQLPDGTTFLGLNPEEVRRITEDERMKAETPEGAVELSQMAAQRTQQEQGVQLAQQVGNVPQPQQGDVTNPPTDIKQALGAGAAAVLPGLAAGAATGAAAGLVGGPAAPITSGVGAAGGAIIGAVGGFIVGVRNNLKAQRQGDIQAAAGGLQDHTRNLNNLIRAANTNPALAADAQAAFNEQLMYIDRDRAKLKMQTQRNLNKFLGADGTPVLADYERFYEVNGQRDYLIQKMQVALLTPNPNDTLTEQDLLGITQ